MQLLNDGCAHFILCNHAPITMSPINKVTLQILSYPDGLKMAVNISFYCSDTIRTGLIKPEGTSGASFSK